MTYRDDLEQARSRIAKLEDDLVDARAETVAVAAKAAPNAEQLRRRRTALVVAGLVVVTLAGALVLYARSRKTSAVPAPIFIRWVDELVRLHPVGEHVRVRGALAHGSEKRHMTGDACTIDFVLEHGGAQLPVHHDDCIVPDLFGREPYWVVGDGELQANGIFVAKDVLVVFRDDMR